MVGHRRRVKTCSTEFSCGHRWSKKGGGGRGWFVCLAGFLSGFLFPTFRAPLSSFANNSRFTLPAWIPCVVSKAGGPRETRAKQRLSFPARRIATATCRVMKTLLFAVFGPASRDESNSRRNEKLGRRASSKKADLLCTYPRLCHVVCSSR